MPDVRREAINDGPQQRFNYGGLTTLLQPPFCAPRARPYPARSPPAGQPSCGAELFFYGSATSRLVALLGLDKTRKKHVATTPLGSGTPPVPFRRSAPFLAVCWYSADISVSSELLSRPHAGAPSSLPACSLNESSSSFPELLAHLYPHLD